MKVWDRRFASREKHPLLEAFNSSIEKDCFLYQAEIKASRAYAQALQRASVLTKKELRNIEAGLKAVKKRIEGGEDLSRFEDIHSAVELLLTEEVGETGKKLHTGRSRNEQVVTDERLYLKKKIPEIIDLLRKIQGEVIKQAEAHFGLIMPGYTHLQQAQCILFSHYILSLFWALERGKSRLHDLLSRVDTLTLGTGALAGSSVALDREYLRRILGFSAISENSIDAVSDRSFILETLFVLSLILLDLSRFAEDFVIYTSQEFGFLHVDDSLATSSSLMPQKKNPDIFELLRAGCARLFGCLSQLFLVLKGLPSSYNKDLQEDKIPLWRGVEETMQILKVFDLALSRIRPNKERIDAGIRSFLFATDMVDYLVDKGIPFREAHGIVSEVVRLSEKERKELEKVDLEKLRKISPVFARDVYDVFDPARSVMKKKTSGSTHPEQVRIQIKKAKSLLSSSLPSSSKGTRKKDL